VAMTYDEALGKVRSGREPHDSSDWFDDDNRNSVEIVLWELVHTHGVDASVAYYLICMAYWAAARETEGPLEGRTMT
jgi:hypothetical protein